MNNHGEDGSAIAAQRRPRLKIGHSTIAARDLDALLGFYCSALGFEVTNRGPAGDDGVEIAFLSQDPGAHHQIAMVGGAMTPPSDFVMIDHLAFRVDTLAELRAVRASLRAAGIDDILQIDHGNAWALYFKDPEGNGVECYVDSPFHVAQPSAGTFDADATDEEIERATFDRIRDQPEFQPMKDWQANLALRLAHRDRSEARSPA